MGSALITFVSLEDPFFPGPVAGERQAGPVLALAAAKPFDRILLLASPQALPNAEGVLRELARRSPQTETEIVRLETPNPRDLPALLLEIGRVAGRVEGGGLDWYANLSAGTQEMRWVWTVVNQRRWRRLKLLRLYWPSYPSLRGASVRELDLAEPEEELLSRPRFQRRLAAPVSPAMFGATLAMPAAAAEAEENPLEVALADLRIVVKSAALRLAAERVAAVAPHGMPLLVLGETGTGKEVFARLLHRLSPRRSRPMVDVNCAALPETLAESMLFGASKGSFTGAVKDMQGKFAEADGGTLFLDEIGELHPSIQAKLLRVLEDGKVEPLGGKAVKCDVRIVAATSRDLKAEVAAGRFRKDLLFRLAVADVRLPPLRERCAEIAPLALEFLTRINNGFAAEPRCLTQAAIKRLENYSWPGNVRELEHVLERSVVYARGAEIDAGDLVIEESPSVPDPLLTLPEPREGFVMEDYIEQVRHQLVVRAVEKANGNFSAAAKLLGVTRQAVSKHFNQEDNES